MAMFFIWQEVPTSLKHEKNFDFWRKKQVQIMTKVGTTSFIPPLPHDNSPASHHDTQIIKMIGT